MYNPVKPTKEKVLKMIRSTWQTPYLKVEESTYPVFKKKFNNYPEVDHTDGIGTKGYYHWKKRSFKAAVVDALAMNLNDLALVRAIPYKLQNHIVLPKDDNKAILEIMKALVKECRKRNIAITGGETSVHDVTNSLDISMTVSGFIKKSSRNQFKNGDVLIGFRSNGLHSNGLTKVRELFKNQFRQEFIQPTKIYSNEVLKLSKTNKINGMIHITGGAFTKLKDLAKGVDLIINKEHKLDPQKIFFDIYKKGLSDKAMYQTFNCGIGFILSVPPRYVKKVLRVANVFVIGKVVKGTGKIRIQSKFSNREIIY